MKPSSPKHDRTAESPIRQTDFPSHFRRRSIGWSKASLLAAIALMFVGCKSGPLPTPSIPKTSFQKTSGHITHVTNLFQRSPRKSKRHANRATASPWNWAAGIPVGAERAGTVAAVLSRQKLAQVCPNFRDSGLRLVSWPEPPSSLEIVNVGGTPIHSLSDLMAASEKAYDAAEEILQIDFTNGSRNQKHVAAEIPRGDVDRIAQATSPDQDRLVTTENGQSWFVLREGPVRAKLAVRIERTTGLLHLVLTTNTHWGTPVTLPRELRVSVDDKPVPCMSVSQTLARLYEIPTNDTAKIDPTADTASYRQVAAREVYRVPGNYNRLNDLRLSQPDVLRTCSAPAFIHVPGATYPGSPLLADARALSGFMKPPEPQEPGHHPETTWVVFADESLKTAGEVTVALTLTNEEIPLRFVFPDE